MLDSGGAAGRLRPGITLAHRPGFMPVLSLAPDGRTLAAIVTRPAGDPRQAELWILPVDGGAGPVVADEGVDALAGLRWSSDGRLAYVRRAPGPLPSLGEMRGGRLIEDDLALVIRRFDRQGGLLPAAPPPLRDQGYLLRPLGFLPAAQGGDLVVQRLAFHGSALWRLGPGSQAPVPFFDLDGRERDLRLAAEQGAVLADLPPLGGTKARRLAQIQLDGSGARILDRIEGRHLAPLAIDARTAAIAGAAGQGYQLVAVPAGQRRQGLLGPGLGTTDLEVPMTVSPGGRYLVVRRQTPAAQRYYLVDHALGKTLALPSAPRQVLEVVGWR